MKKALAIFLTLVLLLCSFSFLMPTYATYRLAQELDLSQYTLDDLADMPADEFRQLLADFERVYDPFDTYETNPIMEKNQAPVIQPLWGSGDSDGSETGSHEIITAQAVVVLTNDLGFFYDNSNPASNIAAALLLSLASVLPDEDERGFPFFVGHFYHAHDGDNYMGSTSNTALTNCRQHFNQAVSYYKSGNENVYLELGRALHYLQDAAQPHHAANITIINPAHTQFEDYVDERIQTYTDPVTSIFGSAALDHNNDYVAARTKTVDAFVKSAALNAYSFVDEVDSILDKSQWDATARITIRLSVQFSAVLLYKFSHSAGFALHRV